MWALKAARSGLARCHPERQVVHFQVGFRPLAPRITSPQARALVSVPRATERLLRFGPASQVASPMALQVRWAGRAGQAKRKKKSDHPRTVHQKGLGKRMEMFWPQHDSFRPRVPMYENSRRHVIYAAHLKKWMVMWYRDGMQVFRTFPAKGSRFEQGRARAIIFFKMLEKSGRLGTPKPDQCRSGVRGVFFDHEEKSWFAQYSSHGMKKLVAFDTQKYGFQTAYESAVRLRVQSVRQQHQFLFQRTRWKNRKLPLGMPIT